MDADAKVELELTSTVGLNTDCTCFITPCSYFIFRLNNNLSSHPEEYDSDEMGYSVSYSTGVKLFITKLMFQYMKL